MTYLNCIPAIFLSQNPLFETNITLYTSTSFLKDRFTTRQPFWFHDMASAFLKLTLSMPSFPTHPYLNKLFTDTPLAFRSLERLTIVDNLNRPLPVAAEHKLLKASFINHNRVSRYTLNFRKIKTLWVSKVTQCTLTPARNHFISYHNKFFLYQKKITKFLFNFYNQSMVNTADSAFSSAKQLLLNSALFSTISEFRWYLMRGFIYLNFNGLTAKTLDSQVGFGDVISLVITPKLNILSIYWDYHFNRIRGKFFYFLSRLRLRASRKPPKQPSFRIPKWVDRIYFDFAFVSGRVETDFLTRSSVCLNLKPQWGSSLRFPKARFLLPFLGMIRTLNWKSIT